MYILYNKQFFDKYNIHPLNVTEDNIKYMIFKNDSEKIKHQEIQKYINEAAV